MKYHGVNFFIAEGQVLARSSCLLHEVRNEALDLAVCVADVEVVLRLVEVHRGYLVGHRELTPEDAQLAVLSVFGVAHEASWKGSVDAQTQGLTTLLDLSEFEWRRRVLSVGSPVFQVAIGVAVGAEVG